jgi:hypothetical protein
MKLKHDNIFTALRILLALSVFLPWKVFSTATGSVDSSASSLFEMRETLEDDVEGDAWELLSASDPCLTGAGADHTAPLHVHDVPDSAAATSTACLPSGWMMPLRI